MRPNVVLNALLLALVAAAGGCSMVSSVISTGARSAIVVLIRPEVSEAGSGSLPMPPRDEIKTALSKRTLWLADDNQAAQWIAYVEVRTPDNPLQPLGLTVVEVSTNPDWNPRAVSTPISARDVRLPTAHDLAEAGEQRERSFVSSSR